MLVTMATLTVMMVVTVSEPMGQVLPMNYQLHLQGKTKLSTVSPHTNRQCASKLKENTQSYAAEPGRQSQPRHQVKLSGGNERARRGHTPATGPEAKGEPAP